MKNPNTPVSKPYAAEIVSNPGKHYFQAIALLAMFGCLLLCGNAATAQTLQLRMPFMDTHGSGTTTPSDTSSGGINITMTNLNPAGTTPVDLHGAPGTGVTNNVATDLTAALDFTSTYTPSQVNQPVGNAADTTQSNAVVTVDLNDPVLGVGLGNGGVITNFVATIWFKQKAMMPNGATIGPRLWILNAGAAGVDSGGSANSMGLKFQQNNIVYFQLGTDTFTVQGNLPSAFPTNKWLFIAVTYDGTNCLMYYGSDTAVAQLIGVGTTANRSISLGGSACLAIGNRHSATANARGFNGWINDFRFYSGVGNAAFVESIRESVLGGPPNISGIFPDGTTLMQGTNTLAFNVTSTASSITNVDLVLNGVDVSGGVSFSGPANNLSCSYSGLAPNQSANAAVITATDANGLSSAASITFDTFSSTNFIVEAEEFDHDSGQYIDNPDYTDGNPADANSYYGLDSTEGIDTHKGGAAGSSTSDYRAGSGVATKTQTPIAAGEQSWPKFFNLLDGSGAPIVGHMVGNWSSGEWQNYTKTFPSGRFNVYARLASSPSVVVTLAKVTSGWGTSSQTTTNLGTFSASTGGFATWQWAPLLDSQGNLAILNLSGTNTLRATSGGGGNADLYMFVPANTNLPAITPVYPTGQYLFEPTNSFLFTVSSPITTIATNNITLTVNGSNVTSSLVFSGGPSTWHVTYSPLQTNQTYNVVIRTVDALGNPAQASVTLDTWNPVFQVEAEDFDFDPNQSPVAGTGARYIDNPVPTAPGVPAANSYEGQVGAVGVDEAGASATGHANYRPNDAVATTPVTDAPRRQFVGGALDYNVGFLGPNFWQQYTKTWPAGTFNIYGRMASGANIGNIHETWQEVIAGWGTASQILTNVGTFTIPTTGGYSAYLYVPLLDRFGNYANVTMSGTNTFRALELTDPTSFGLNINFYMLTAPRTELPRIDNVYPDGSMLMQKTNTLSFIASSIFGINTTNVQVTLNGINISSLLAFSGSTNTWNVSYSGLQPNTAYTAAISITDGKSQNHTTTVNFDTFDPNAFTWEAEDFDFDPAFSPVSSGNGLRFIDNPAPGDLATEATNVYFGQTGDQDIDYSSAFQTIIGTYIYRPSDFISTEVTSDTLRQKYRNAQLAAIDPGIVDYDVNWLAVGGWINYTRTFPTGNFYLYARLSAGNGAFKLQCAQVTSGAGTSVQSSNVLGNFIGTGTSFATWQYVPLVDANTNKVVLSLGAVETLQFMGDTNENANFYVLVPVAPPPVSLTATLSPPNILVSFPTTTGFTYTLSNTPSLSPPSWSLVGSSLPGDGTIKTITNGLNSSPPQEFYRLSIH